jgi:hypothetical protein
MTGRLNPWRRYAIYGGFWVLMGAFFFSQELAQRFFAHDPTPWWHYFFAWQAGFAIVAILTPGALWLGRRFPMDRENWRRRLPIHLAGSFVFALLDTILASMELPFMGVLPPPMNNFVGAFMILLVIGFHGAVVSYWIILCVQYATRYYRGYHERLRESLRLELDAARLKTELVNAQLSALKMQLQPHFLFNTLNAIVVLVRQQRSHQAEEMLGRLSDLLRAVLEDVDTQEIPFRRELEYLRLYLSIEQVRFGDRLHVDISTDPSVLDAAFPHMGLQPMVENAIRHGVGRMSSAGQIRIQALRLGGKLEIRIQDDGPGFDRQPGPVGKGIGLSNTRARLQQLYGHAASLTTEDAETGGALVVLTLPYRAVADVQTEVVELHAFDDVAG